MTERKLRSRNFSLVRDGDEACQKTIFVEAEVNDASHETEPNGPLVELNEGVHSVTDRQMKGHSDSSNNGVMSANQFHEFMSTVMKEFDDLKSRMSSENTKLAESIKTVTDEMSTKIEVANQNLCESLTKQFGEENESLRKEFSSKLKAEILDLTEAMNQLRKDTDLEVASLSHSVEAVREKLNDRVNEHMSVAKRQVECVSQEMNKRTRELAAELTDHITQTKNDVVAVRQEMAELGEHVSTKVTDGVKAMSDNLVVCNNQILAEKESSLLKFQKLDQEIEILKAKVASWQASQNNITPSGSVSVENIIHSVSTCGDVANVELSQVSNTAVVNATSEMPINRDSLGELSLPSFVDGNKQSVVTFMRDLDMYFEIKQVPENLKLPLVLRAIKDPFAQNWVSSEYHKMDSYQSFKSQFSRLFWNELEQSRVRCDIYQGKYDRNGGESMTEHYVRYASLAANLQPPLAEYDLVTALTSHFSIEIQRTMLAANVRSSQEALAFLGRMQSLENAQEVYKKLEQEQSSTDFYRKQPKGRDQGGGSSYRDTPRDVRHVRQGYRQSDPGTPYRQNTPMRQRNYQADRGNMRQAHELNPRIPEFQPRHSNVRQRSEQESMNTERPTVNNPNQEN